MSLFKTGARGFAWTVGRTVAVVLCGALLAWCGGAKAHGGVHVSRQQAWEHCKAAEAAYDAANGTTDFECVLQGGTDEFKTYQLVRGQIWAAFSWETECPAGMPWNEETKTCGSPCDGKADLGASAILQTIDGKKCSGGCAYEPKKESGPAPKVQFVVMGGQTFSVVWKATGGTCQRPDDPEKPYDPDKPVCQSIGTKGAVQCAGPDNKQCITFSSGLKTCWDNNLDQEGPRQAQDGKDGASQSKAPEGSPPPPVPEPPSNMANPTPDGPAKQTIINGNQYNTQNFSGTGTAGPGQSNVGPGGNEPGSEPGAGPGPGSGDDGGDEGEGDGPGQPGGGLGEFYEGDGETVGDVFGDFRTRVEAAPIAQGLTGFLTFSGGNSCPIFTVPASEYWETLTFDFHCNGVLADALAAGGYLILAIAAFAAFRIGFY